MPVLWCRVNWVDSLVLLLLAVIFPGFAICPLLFIYFSFLAGRHASLVFCPRIVIFRGMKALGVIDEKRVLWGGKVIFSINRGSMARTMIWSSFLIFRIKLRSYLWLFKSTFWIIIFIIIVWDINFLICFVKIVLNVNAFEWVFVLFQQGFRWWHH